MHLFHAPPYLSSIRNYLKKKKKSQLKFPFHSCVSVLLLPVWSIWMDHWIGMEMPASRLRIYVEGIQKQCLFYLLWYNLPDDRTLKFCINHLRLITYETEPLPRFYSNLLPFYIHMHTKCTVMNIEWYASVTMLIQVLHYRNIQSFNLLLEILIRWER